MTGPIVTRRRLLGVGALGAGGLLLSGCDRLNGSAGFRDVLESAEGLHRRAQRLIGDGQMDVGLAQLNELGQQYSDQPDQLALLQTVYEYGQSLADGLE